MPDKLTAEQRHRCMSRIRAKNTKPEVVVRRWLWKAGFRYRLYAKDLPGTPDLVMRKYRIAIFVNGCFWHGHHAFRMISANDSFDKKLSAETTADLSGWSLENSECCKIPKSNSEFWRKKITRNIERDMANFHWLKSKGWTVLVVWECQLRGKERQEQTLRALVRRIDQLILEHYGSRSGKKTDPEVLGNGDRSFKTLPKPYTFDEDSTGRMVADESTFLKEN